MLAPLIALEPVEPELDGARIDARLAQGWFPYGQRWMTCRIWPEEAAPPHDTVWLRVRLAAQRRSDRLRQLARQGGTLEWTSAPRFDAEHQELYSRFKAGLHPDWYTEIVWGLLLDGEQLPGPMFHHTREIAVRDREGRLLAFRWFLQGQASIAGIACVYDPERSGLGTIARALADRWAFEQGLTWTYPGYVRPGFVDPWDYKVKEGRTEWLDPDTGQWHPWESGGPPLSRLSLAEMRQRLADRGVVEPYRWWEVSTFDPTSRELPVPFYVAGARHGRNVAVTVWDVVNKRYVELLTREIDDVPWQSRLEVIGPIG